MSEYYEHNPQDHEDPLPGPTWLLGVVGAALLIVIILGLTALYYNAQAGKFEDRVLRTEFRELQRLYDDQREKITGRPRWVERRGPDDEVTDHFVIPIDLAKEKIVNEYGSNRN